MWAVSDIQYIVSQNFVCSQYHGCLNRLMWNKKYTLVISNIKIQLKSIKTKPTMSLKEASSYKINSIKLLEMETLNENWLILLFTI